MIAAPRAFGVEHERARNVLVLNGLLITLSIWILDESASRSQREADIVLRERRRSRSRRQQIIELGHLDVLVEAAAVVERMQQCRHPPGEPLCLPHARQGAIRVCVDAACRAVSVVLGKCFAQIADVAGGEIEALGARRRYDVRGIACER